MNIQTSIKNLGHKKFALVFLILVISSYFLCQFFQAYSYRLEIGQTDSAGFLDLISRHSILKPLQGDYFRSARGLELLLNNGSEKICSVLPKSNIGDPSFFGIHPYLIAIPISFLSWILPVNEAAMGSILQGSSVFAALFAIVLFLHKLKFSKVVIAIFSSCFLFYPVLYQSILGQAYFDRLMVGPGTILFLLVWWSRHRDINVWPWICAIGFLLALISERGAALAVLIMVGYSLLLHGKNCFKLRELRLIIASGVIIFLYFYAWTTKWQSYGAYGQLSLALAKTRFGLLWESPLLSLTQTFFMVSLAFLTIALFSGRGFLILIVSMSSNLLISVGGAELTGFATHYHQTYLPVIIGAATIGFVQVFFWIQDFFGSKRFNWLPLLLSFFLLVGTLQFGSSALYARNVKALAKESQSVWFPNSSYLQSLRVQKNVFQEISSYVMYLDGDAVSAPEALMPSLLLSGVRDVEYWPVGVGVADVIIAPFTEDEPNVYPYGAPAGVGPTLTACTKAVLESKYVFVKSFINGTVRIYRKL